VAFDKKIEANKEVVVEVILTDEDGLITNKTECIFETLDCEVPEMENWIKQEISFSHEVITVTQGFIWNYIQCCYFEWFCGKHVNSDTVSEMFWKKTFN
jgi:hypothetical protein